ncbi:MAG: helix-turn-helix transcriptional regulator [Marinoscillum sp.]
MGEELIAKKFGLHLRALREAKGISQEKLGLTSDIHPTYVSLLERGINQPTLSTIIALSKSLGIEIDELLSPFIRNK